MLDLLFCEFHTNASNTIEMRHSGFESVGRGTDVFPLQKVNCEVKNGDKRIAYFQRSCPETWRSHHPEGPSIRDCDLSG